MSKEEAGSRNIAGDAARERRGMTAQSVAALVGTSSEWYDFFLYATAAAVVFPTTFFPSALDPSVALLASFSTFAVGFLARPVGAVLFGHIGDKAGRKSAFAAALVIMGVASTLIGVLPSYKTAGVLAPLALVLLRLVQGLAVGGQWGGALLLATESARGSTRGLCAGIAQAGIPIGVVLANLAFLLASGATSSATFMAYTWRIPFIASVVLVALAAIIHFRLEDTASLCELRGGRLDARNESDTSRRASGGRELSPVLSALRLYHRSILVAAGANVAGMLAFYILITYVVAYGTGTAGLHMPRSLMLGAVLIANIAMIPGELLAGKLSDSYGRRPIIIIGLVLLGLWGFALFPLMQTRSFVWITVAITVGQCLVALIHAPVSALMAELFRVGLRYSATSLAYQISSVIGGSLAPIIASALYARYNDNIFISIYMALACTLSLACVAAIKRVQIADHARSFEPAVASIR
jgi:MFS family permease